MNRLIRMIPGVAAMQIQINIWRAQMRELRPFYPVVIPYLLWTFTRSYQREQERMRLRRAAPILRPERRLPENR